MIIFKVVHAPYRASMSVGLFGRIDKYVTIYDVKCVCVANIVP